MLYFGGGKIEVVGWIFSEFSWVPSAPSLLSHTLCRCIKCWQIKSLWIRSSWPHRGSGRIQLPSVRPLTFDEHLEWHHSVEASCLPCVSIQGSCRTKTSLCSSQTRACWICECELSVEFGATTPARANRKLRPSVAGWSVPTQHSSTPSSWCCTRWRAACRRSPAAAPRATSRPVLTVICRVRRTLGAGSLFCFEEKKVQTAGFLFWQEASCSKACLTTRRISSRWVSQSQTCWPAG